MHTVGVKLDAPFPHDASSRYSVRGTSRLEPLAKEIITRGHLTGECGAALLAPESSVGPDFPFFVI